nr:PREDICTED: uncharacterized protein LOC103546945 [Equus przewalskii]
MANYFHEDHLLTTSNHFPDKNRTSESNLPESRRQISVRREHLKYFHITELPAEGLWSLPLLGTDVCSPQSNQGPTQTRTDLEKLRERRRGSSRRWCGDPRRLVPGRADAAPLHTKRFSCTGRYFPKMPRLVGAQNPHRKVPRAARGGTHGVRINCNQRFVCAVPVQFGNHELFRNGRTCQVCNIRELGTTVYSQAGSNNGALRILIYSMAAFNKRPTLKCVEGRDQILQALGVKARLESKKGSIH